MGDFCIAKGLHNMNDIPLHLRHRKIINYLQHAGRYVTGKELASVLNVSPRTIRLDVNEINRMLAEEDVQIRSRQHYGYIIEARNVESLMRITKSSGSYISRDERLRHIALRLCLEDGPINLDDLADEMYVSRTTLEHDLTEFRHEYVLPAPHIQLYREKSCIRFEDDEWKKRILLINLYANNWDYNGRGNAFYQYDFLDEKTVSICMREVNYYLDDAGIRIEDVNMVRLVLFLSISYHRLKSGHVLRESTMKQYVLPKAEAACAGLFQSLEEKLCLTFPQPEREAAVNLVSCSVLPDVPAARQLGADNVFDPSLISFADTYLNALKTRYGFDFSQDQDFYFTLLFYLRYLSMPVHYLNMTGIDERYLHDTHAIEFEFAFFIEDYAIAYYGNYLDFPELMYLSFLFSGVIQNLRQEPVSTIIMTQYNLLTLYDLKAKIMKEFPGQLNVTALLPVYLKDNLDFSKTELILTTVDKAIVSNDHTTTLHIDTFLASSDRESIEKYLQRRKFQVFYRHPMPDLVTLLQEASWNEMLEYDTYFDVLDFLGRRLIESGCVNEHYLTQLYLREKIMSSACMPHFVIVHSCEPALKTHIEIGVMNHRLRIAGNKIRMVIMVCMREEDSGLIFYLYNALYNGPFDPAETRFFKTKEEYLHYFDRIEREKA